MLKMDISISGNARTKSKLARLGSSLYDFGDEMDEIGKRAAEYFAGVVFASQGGVLGQVWPRLNPRYAAYKAKLYPGKGPLVATGTMKDSFEYEASDQSVNIGNTAPQFKYHQSTLPRKKIPRRAMIGANKAIRTLVHDIIHGGISRKIEDL